MTAIIDSKDIEKIVLEHLLRVRQLEDETCLVLKERVENLVVRLLLKVNQNLKAIESIKAYDCLYYETENLKEGYEAFISALDAHPGLINDDKVRQIFSGLRTMTMDFLDDMPSKTDNPVTYERMVLISGAVLKIKQFWTEAIEKAFRSCSIGNDVSKELLLNFMTKEVRSFFFDSMFEATQLLDEHMRHMADFEEGKKYEGILRGQMQQLSVLGMMQKDVVLAQAATPEEGVFLQEVIELLGKCYKQVMTALEKLDEKPREMSPVSDLFNMEMVDELLDAYIFDDAKKIRHLFRAAGEIREESVQALRSIIETEVNYRSTEISKKVKRQASDYQLLSGQLVGVFSDAVQKLKNLQLDCSTDKGKAIGEGIQSTMALKLDAIREKDTAYQTGKKELSIELEQLLVEQRRIFVEQTDHILEDILDGSERILARTTKMFMDSVEGVIAKHFRFDMAYLKNDLLFELRTFEELIEHSLKRYIELEQEGADDLTEVMIGAMEKSRDILKAHAIELIIPKAHDKFDAKAHEVLMAEETVGFIKGEIIRCVNVGYRKKDHIIIRASVMAAK